jgi:site-specific DNA-methyltransferase (adenine-specific)
MRRSTANYVLASVTTVESKALAAAIGDAKLIVTSPPYNLDKDYGGASDLLAYDHYLQFMRVALAVLYAYVPDGCRLCLNLPLDTNRGGQRGVYSDVTAIAQEIGWRYQSTIIWNEGTISRRTAWGSWASASAPYVIAPVETIVVLYKGDSWKRLDHHEPSDITRDEFLAWTNGLWTFNGESAKRVGHPAPFPIELPRRCIKMFSFPGDKVVDPFAGSGTTLLIAEVLGRPAVGLDINSEYRKVYRHRRYAKEYEVLRAKYGRPNEGG